MRSIARLPVFLMALIICVCSLMPMSAFAAGTVGGGEAVFGTENHQYNNGGTGGGGTNSDKYGYIPSASEALGLDQVPEVDTDDVQKWVDRKGGELISIGIRVVQVVSVIGFILCIVLIVIGAVGNSRTLVGGVVGLVISCVCFTVATMAPQIVGAVNGWLIS